MMQEMDMATRILVVDDDDQVRSLFDVMLRRAGYEVICAPDGRVALQELSRCAVDLIITDIFMPEKEGLETIMEIRRAWPDLKVIAVSGGGRHGNMDYLEIARKLGASATLSKPIERRTLLETVRGLVEADAPKDDC
jgi:CheY-like chemotaxis protein